MAVDEEVFDDESMGEAVVTLDVLQEEGVAQQVEHSSLIHPVEHLALLVHGSLLTDQELVLE